MEISPEIENKTSICALFDRTVRHFPQQIALEFNGKKITYEHLNHSVIKVAEMLAGPDKAQETLVGVCFERSPDMIIAMLAILKAGKAYVPIDPILPEPRMRYVLEDSGITTVLSTSQLDPGKFSLDIHLIDIDLLPKSQNVNSVTAIHKLPEIEGSNLAYVIYTSGSTGNPKGVMIQHHAVANLLTGFSARLNFGQQHKWLGIAPISFDMSVADWLACLATGGTYVIPTEQLINDPYALSNLIDKANINVLQATPSRWRQIIDSGWKGNPDLIALCGGEALSTTLLKDLRKRCGQVWNCYGPTEATVWSLIRNITVDDDPTTSLYLGNQLPNYCHYVLDGNGNFVATGETGELCISGPGLAKGYLNQAELTQNQFIYIEDDNQQSVRIYKTGDLVKLSENDLYEFVGRIDHQVKIRGYRIEIGEIENALLTITGVKQVIIDLVKINNSDESKILVAYVEMPGFEKIENSDKAGLLESEYKTLLSKILPEYMLPTRIIFLSEFPLNPNGKVDRHSLPPPFSTELIKESDLPSTQLEITIYGIWKSIFPELTIGINDNYFSLGGNSLNSIKLIGQLRNAFPTIQINPSDIIEYPTVKMLASYFDLQIANQKLRNKSTCAEEEPAEREVFTI